MKFKVGDRVRSIRFGFTGVVLNTEKKYEVAPDGSQEIFECVENELEFWEKKDDITDFKFKITQEKQEQMRQLKKRSGKINSEDPLVSFLYELMRDHISCGVVESIVLNCNIMQCHFTNGYLAQYAIDIANRLRKKDD